MSEQSFSVLIEQQKIVVVIQLLYCLLLLNNIIFLKHFFFVVSGHWNKGLRVLIQEDPRGVRDNVEERGELFIIEKPGAEAIS
jgi:hypothetical protein